MNVLTSSWRRWLAAMVLVALLSPALPDAAADDDRPDAGGLLAQRDDEHPQRERAEGREPQRPDREAREEENRRRQMEQRERFQRQKRLVDLLHEQQELRQRAARIERELGALKEGQAERREDLEQELQEIRRRMQELQRRFRGPGQERPPHEMDQRRLRHLKVAIENLRAAGLHDHAERLAGELRRKTAEHRRRDRPRGEGPPHRERPERTTPEHPDRIVHELRGEVRQLRREVDELRGLVKKLLQRERLDR